MRISPRLIVGTADREDGLPLAVAPALPTLVAARAGRSRTRARLQASRFGGHDGATGDAGVSGPDDLAPAGTPDDDRLADVWRQQREIFERVVEYQRAVARDANRHELLSRARRIVEMVEDNFRSEQRWLLAHARHQLRAQRLMHQQLLEEVSALHDALGGATELAPADLMHGFDSLLLHYVASDLFYKSERAAPRRRK